MKILVTGANGQLGSELKKASDKVQHTLFFTDIPELDIADKSAVSLYVKEKEIDIIVNCAAYTNVDKAENDRDNAFHINAEGPKVLAEVSKESGSTLVHVSTDYVFDGNSIQPYKETDATNPTCVYGESKLAGEQFVISTGCKSIIIRTSWLYSSFGHNFLKTMLRLGNERREIKVVSDQTGTPTYACDLAKAILEIIPQIAREPRYGDIYHYSNSGSCTWYEFAKRIMEFSGTNCEVEPIASAFYPTPVSRPVYSVLDKEKIKTAFELVIPEWEDSLRDCLQALDIPNNR